VSSIVFMRCVSRVSNVMCHCMAEYTTIRVRKEVSDRYRAYCLKNCLAVSRYCEFLLEQAMVGDQPAPWEITTQARRDWLAIKGLPETPETLAKSVEELGLMSLDALAAERTRRRAPQHLPSGMLRYRGPAPDRLIMMVLNGQVVAVVPPLAPEVLPAVAPESLGPAVPAVA
jgi:hypothetical protein